MNRRAAALIVATCGFTQPAMAACSLTTMDGSWALKYSGLNFDLQYLCSGIGTIKFSSRNRAVTVPAVIESCNGELNSNAGSGTYTLNSACQGTMDLTSNTGRQYLLRFVVSRGGTAVDFILLTSGTTFNGSLSKM